MSALTSYTREEVAKHTTEDDCWIIISNNVYDVTKWLPKHPGGSNLILNLAGRDCTEEFKVFHYKPSVTRLRQFFIGILVENEHQHQTGLSKDIDELMDKLKKQGAFLPDYWFYVVQALIIISLFAGCVYFIQSPSYIKCIISAFCLGMMWQQLAFFGHDLGHHVFTHNYNIDNNIGYIFGNALQGISLAWWRHNHNTHHTVTNSVNHDPDIQHLPVLAVCKDFFSDVYSTYYCRIMKFDSVANWFVRWQHFLFYPIMSLARINLYVQSFIHNTLRPDSNSNSKKLEILSLGLFWVWHLYLLSFTHSWSHRILFFFFSHATAGIVHVQICINHFPMQTFLGTPQSAYESDGYIKSQLVTTTNISCSRYMDFFHGGLQFQVEHHIFPHLTRSWFRYVQGELQKLCEKHSLTYHKRSFYQANYDVIVKLYKTSLESRVADVFSDALNLVG